MNDAAILIRRGDVADAAALAEFAARTFSDAFGAQNNPDDLRAYLETAYGAAQQAEELANPALITLLAFAGDDLVAYAQVRQSAPPPPVTHAEPVELRRFYVDGSAQGRGIGRVLMGAVREAARELGGRHLWLSAWERNPGGLAFYEKMGFEDVGATVFVVGTDTQRDRVLVANLTETRASG